MKLILSSVIALVLFTGGTTSILAANIEHKLQSTLDMKTTTVNFADLNPRDPTDAQVLLKRIHNAARKVCKRANPGRRIEDVMDRGVCLADSYENAISSLNAKRGIDVEVLAGKPAPSREFVITD